MDVMDVEWQKQQVYTIKSGIVINAIMTYAKNVLQIKIEAY